MCDVDINWHMVLSNNKRIVHRGFVVVRDGDTVKHYRVRQLDEGSFFIARRVTFPTLANLVEHYTRDADGLCVNLKKPCSPVNLSIAFILLVNIIFMFLSWSIAFLSLYLVTAFISSNSDLQRVRFFSCSIIMLFTLQSI